MASGGSRDDELARTATAPISPGARSEPARHPAPELGATLGRYRIERTLGEGGMGVVHAAFDPDLERRVALKVLRDEDEAGDARQRLLREARAMARLTHPNVVSVYEVGSVTGRDYVAMELVEGETLADWLRAAPRDPDEIVAAFVAAGRGLAAAHAADLVHRDFKPHNVLRRGDGRICVTDFGLARGVEHVVTKSIAVKPPPPPSDNTPSPLSGLTATGSVLGTPAYMAPEQWDGGTVGPAADQFAFCVALWEALTGDRPFYGATLDELHAAVTRGAGTLDASHVPRRLRAVLRRGLAANPRDRWPSMDALLAAIVSAERRPRIVLASVGAALAIAASVTFAALGHRASPHAAAPVDNCAAPARDPAAVWSPARAAALEKAGQAVGAAELEADFTAWQKVRVAACHADAAVRPAKLACLDGVLARMDLAARALDGAKDAPGADIGDLLVAPDVCARTPAPRLALQPTPGLDAVALATVEDAASTLPVTPARADALVAKVAGDPCATSLARLHALEAHRTTTAMNQDIEAADAAAQGCGDDELAAVVAITRAELAYSLSEPDFPEKLARARAAAKPVMQPDLRAVFETLRARVALGRDLDLETAIAQLAAARDDYAARHRLERQLDVARRREELLEQRAHPDDLAHVAGHLASWLDLASHQLGPRATLVRALQGDIAGWEWSRGDVAAAYDLRRALASPPWPLQPIDHAVRAAGRVIDEHGAPVAGATVIAGVTLTADARGITYDTAQRRTTTAADGSFELAEAPDDGIVVAELPGRRSAQQKVGDHLVLALAPTSRVEGRVDLRGEAPTSVTVVVGDPARLRDDIEVDAPVAPDGSFVVEGVPRGNMAIGASVERTGVDNLRTRTPLVIAGPVVSGVHVAVPTTTRVVQLVVRSTIGAGLTHAEAWIAQGHIAPKSAAEMFRGASSFAQCMATVPDEHAPAAARARAKPGDVWCAMRDVPDGAATACAVWLPSEIDDPDLYKKANDHLDKIPLGCTPVGVHDDVVLVEVPPWPRFD
jgi:hypothetical protein